MGKLKFNVDEILQPLSQAVSVVNSKNAIPVLGNVVFQARLGERHLTITSSDGETWLTIKAPCIESDENLVFGVSATDIFKVLSNLKGKEVEFLLDSSTHTIQGVYKKGHFTMPYEDTTEYPRPNMDMADATKIGINASNFMRALNKTSFAIASEKLRLIMNGIHFDFLQEQMIAVSTDGQKLAKYVDTSVKNEQKEGAVNSFTLPRKPTSLLSALLNGCDSDVNLTFTDKCVSVSSYGFVLLTRLLEGRYPHVDRVIPTDNTVETVVNKNDMIEALKRVLPMGNATSELVNLGFSIGNVKISAEDSSFSKAADESIDCDYASQELSIGFNGGFLLDVLQNIDGESVKICLKEPSRAGIFKPTEPQESEDYILLLMPIFM